jgi:hypothetical protein
MWKPALQDALRNQRPKLVVVDVFGGGYEREMIETRSSQLYLIMNSIPLSAEKIRMAKEISKNVNNVSAASMVFPFIKCHSRVPINLLRLKERLETEKFGPSPLKGLETRTRTRQLAFVDDVSFSEETMPIDEKTEGVIRDFLDYCKSQDLKVLFVKYPTVLTQEDPDELLVNLRANRICEIAEEYGFDSLNMQKDFLIAMLKQVKNEFTIDKATSIIKTAYDSLKTNMPLDDMIYFYTEGLRKMNLNEDIKFYTMPWLGTGKYNGQDYVYLDEVKSIEMINNTINPYTTPLTTDDIYVQELYDKLGVNIEKW